MTGDDGPHTFRTSGFFFAPYLRTLLQEGFRHIYFFNSNLHILISSDIGVFTIESSCVGLLCDRTDTAQPPGPKSRYRCGGLDYIHFCQLIYAGYTLFPATDYHACLVG